MSPNPTSSEGSEAENTTAETYRLVCEKCGIEKIEESEIIARDLVDGHNNTTHLGAPAEVQEVEE